VKLSLLKASVSIKLSKVPSKELVKRFNDLAQVARPGLASPTRTIDNDGTGILATAMHRINSHPEVSDASASADQESVRELVALAAMQSLAVVTSLMLKIWPLVANDRDSHATALVELGHVLAELPLDSWGMLWPLFVSDTSGDSWRAASDGCFPASKSFPITDQLYSLVVDLSYHSDPDHQQLLRCSSVILAALDAVARRQPTTGMAESAPSTDREPSAVKSQKATERVFAIYEKLATKAPAASSGTTSEPTSCIKHELELEMMALC
jgi:hypothetical protein